MGCKNGVDMENKEEYKFPFGEPIGYTLYYDNVDLNKRVYFLHNFESNDDILGDRLPEGEDLAIQYCRVAMEGWEQSRKFILEKIRQKFLTIKTDLDETLEVLEDPQI